MKKIYIAIALLTSILAKSQEFTFGSKGADRGIDIIQTKDAGYLLTGSWHSNQSDILLLKTTPKGDIEWNKTYGGSGDDFGWCVIALEDGYAVYGFTDSFNDNKTSAFLLKTNLKGDSLWMKTYLKGKEQLGWNIREMPNGNFVSVSQYTPEKKELPDILVQGINRNGKESWSLSLGNPSRSDRAFYLELDNEENILITGLSALNEKQDDDVYAAKISKKGKLIWERTFDMGNLELGHTIIPYGDHYYIFGYTKTDTDGMHHPLLLKLNKEGQTIMSKVLTEVAGDTRVLHGQVTEERIIMTGYQRLKGNNHLDGLVITCDLNGKVISEKTYGDEWQDMGYTIRMLDDDKYVMIGNKMTSSTNPDIFMVIDK